MRRLLIASLVTAGLVGTVLIAGTVFSGDISGEPDDILIYEANANVPGRPSVTLDDQFIDALFRVKKLDGLGVPTKKTPFGGYGYEPEHLDFHYATYKVKTRAKVGKVNVTVTDQFGTRLIQVKRQKPDRLLVPAFKAPGVTAPTPPTITQLEDNKIDHYLCYRIKLLDGGFTEVNVTVDDQFTNNKTIVVKKPKKLCAPVNKLHPSVGVFPINNDDGISGPHLMCYKVKLKGPKNPKATVALGDQFITTKIKIDTRKPKELCVPAEKVP